MSSQSGQSLPSDCSPTGSEVWQGPVQGKPVAEVGVVAVVLELLQGLTPAFGAELLTPVCKQGRVREGLSLCLFRLGRSLWRKKGQGDSGSEGNPAHANINPSSHSPSAMSEESGAFMVLKDSFTRESIVSCMQ